MGNSYIRQGTFVICTNMLSGKKEIGVPDDTPRYVFYNGDSNMPLLHQLDNKISDTFVCKNPIKKFGGLISMLIGIVVGAIVIAAVCTATAATGGAALIIIGAAIVVTAAAGSGALMYSKCHDCDETLSCQWIGFHAQVTIEGGKHPILKRSTLVCTACQGVIYLMINADAADKAASYIRKQNMKEIGVQLGSQFLEGFVGGLTGGYTPWGLVISVGMYCWGEEENPIIEESTNVEKIVEGQATLITVSNVGDEVAKIVGINKESTLGSSAIDMMRSGVVAAAYEKEAAAQVAELYRLNNVVDAAASNAAEAAARQSAVGRTASIPSRGQVQAQRIYQSVKESADDAAEALIDARAIRSATQKAASKAANNADDALQVANKAKGNLGKGIAKGIGSFVASVAIEVMAENLETNIRKDTFEQAKIKANADSDSIDIIANY